MQQHMADHDKEWASNEFTRYAGVSVPVFNWLKRRTAAWTARGEGWKRKDVATPGEILLVALHWLRTNGTLHDLSRDTGFAHNTLGRNGTRPGLLREGLRALERLLLHGEDNDQSPGGASTY